MSARRASIDRTMTFAFLGGPAGAGGADAAGAAVGDDAVRVLEASGAATESAAAAGRGPSMCGDG